MSKKNSTRRQIISSGIAFAVLALFFGLWSKHNIANAGQTQKLEIKSGTVFPNPRLVSPFKLVDAKYQVFTNKNLTGHWSLLFFGFTNCPMLCPTTLTTLNQTYQQLVDKKVSSLPQVIFISVDTESDTPKKADNYAKTFNKAFTGITGAKDQIDHLAKELNVLYMKIDQNSKDKSYTIDHSGTVLLIDPEGRLHALFSQPLDSKLLAEDYKTIIKH